MFHSCMAHTEGFVFHVSKTYKADEKNNAHHLHDHLDLVSALKLTSWLSFMELFNRSACVVRAAFFSKARYLVASLSACT